MTGTRSRVIFSSFELGDERYELADCVATLEGVESDALDIIVPAAGRQNTLSTSPARAARMWFVDPGLQELCHGHGGSSLGDGWRTQRHGDGVTTIATPQGSQSSSSARTPSRFLQF